MGRPGPPPLYAPPVLKALASASINSIGHPLVLKALALHLYKKTPATTCFKSFPVHFICVGGAPPQGFFVRDVPGCFDNDMCLVIFDINNQYLVNIWLDLVNIC